MVDFQLLSRLLYFYRLNSEYTCFSLETRRKIKFEKLAIIMINKEYNEKFFEADHFNRRNIFDIN